MFKGNNNINVNLLVEIMNPTKPNIFYNFLIKYMAIFMCKHTHNIYHRKNLNESATECLASEIHNIPDSPEASLPIRLRAWYR